MNTCSPVVTVCVMFSLVGGVVVADHLSQDPLLVSVHGLHPRRHLVALFGHVVAAGRRRPAQRRRADTENDEEEKEEKYFVISTCTTLEQLRTKIRHLDQVFTDHRIYSRQYDPVSQGPVL